MADFDQLKEWVTDSWDEQADWREEAEDDFNFDAGHQWDEEAKRQLEDNNRNALVFNRTAVIISSVTGAEINNRTEVRFIPREIGDVKPNEVLTSGGEWFRDQADAEDADSEAFRDLLICGVGATETRLDFDQDPEGEPAIDHLDVLELGWDHTARKKGLTDARYVFRVRSMPCSDAEERFPDHELHDIDASWIDRPQGAKKGINFAGDEYAHGDSESEGPGKNGLVTIVQVQWRERKKFVEYVDPETGERQEMDAERWQKIMAMAEMDVPYREFRRTEWKQAFLGRDEILEENQPNKGGPTITFMTGYWDRKDNRFYGILRAMKDPQMYANKWLSQTMHIINTNAKGGVMAETSVVDDVQKFEESWAASDAVTWLRTGSLSSGAIQPKPTTQMPSALMQLTEFAISSIRDASGVNLELLGMRDANQPGVLEYQRRQSAMTTLARFFDALRFYRKNQGQVILHYLREYIAPTGRLVRIVKDDQEQYVPLAVQDGVEKYDTIVDDAPSAPNEKEKAWSVIEAMMPMLMNANLGMDDWADILEYSPLPSSFADKVREKAKSQDQQGPSPAQQLEMAAKQAEIRETESQTKENEANAFYDTVRAQAAAQEARLRPVQTQLEIAKMMQGGRQQ